jgi:uncharacterized membrane protein YczE
VGVRSLVGRGVLLFVGSSISAVAYAATIRAGLGLGPLFVLQAAVARHASIALGTSVTVLGFLFILIAMALRSWPGPGTLVLPVLGGETLDSVLPHVPAFHGWGLRLGIVVVATAAMGFGGALVIRASIGIDSYNSVMIGLLRFVRRPLTFVRLAMEVGALAAGWALGGPVGVGTLITGLLIGPTMQLWLRCFRHESALAG